jgi:hypothetical protein
MRSSRPVAWSRHERSACLVAVALEEGRVAPVDALCADRSPALDRGSGVEAPSRREDGSQPVDPRPAHAVLRVQPVFVRAFDQDVLESSPQKGLEAQPVTVDPRLGLVAIGATTSRAVLGRFGRKLDEHPVHDARWHHRLASHADGIERVLQAVARRDEVGLVQRAFE